MREFEEHYIRELGKSHEKTWGIVFDRYFKHPSYVGHAMYLYDKYGCPTDFKTMYEKYTSDCIGENQYHRGRSTEELMKIARQFKMQCDDEVTPVEDFYWFLIYKSCISTIEGRMWEGRAYEYIKKLGYAVEPPKHFEDTKGVDGKVFKDGKLVYLIQVKSLSFFKGNRIGSVLEERVKAYENKDIFKNTYGVPLLFMLYDKNNNDWYRRSDGGVSFSIEMLINADGTTKI